MQFKELYRLVMESESPSINSEVLTPAEYETHNELVHKFQKILRAANINLTAAQIAVSLAAFGGSQKNDLSGVNPIFYKNGRKIIDSLIDNGANKAEINALLSIEKKRAENLEKQYIIRRDTDKQRIDDEEMQERQKLNSELKEIRDRHYPIRELDNGNGEIYFRILGLVPYFRTREEAEKHRDEERPVKYVK